MSAGAAHRTVPVFQLSKDCLTIPMKLHVSNRQRLCDRLRSRLDNLNLKGSFVVLQGGSDTYIGDSDSANVFRQESFFHWAFGVLEPDCYGVISVETGFSLIFVPRISDEIAIYDGKPHSLEESKNKYQVDGAHYVDQITEVLGINGAKLLLTLSGLNTDSGRMTMEAKFPGIENFKVNSQLLHPEIVACRVIKTEYELDVLRYSNRVSSLAHKYLMQRVKPGMYEYQVESLFKHFCYYHGGLRHVSYTCIGASGCNCAILHYGHAGSPNERQIQDGDMCLFDMGGEYYCYASDITCSYPVNGRFTDDQKLIYEAVLDASRSVLDSVRPGANWAVLHELAERKILNHLIRGGVLAGDSDAMMKVRLGAVFMPHGLGHLMGCDVHDVGGYTEDTPPRPSLRGLKNLRTARVLEENMVLTVEPGCYFIDSLLDEALASPTFNVFIVREQLERFRKFGGVRIEDNIVVTKSGHELLTQVPRTVPEIEEWMSSCSLELELKQ